MGPVKCEKCHKELDTSMEIEYSREVNEFFCSPVCATDRYYDYMGSTVLDIEDSSILEGEGVTIINGKLISEEAI